MSCETPMTAYRPTNGGPVTFRRPQQHTYEEIELPCGVCILCRQAQARQTAIRLVHEADQHEESSFITLTYADEHLPPFGGLRYVDLVKFWKRLRKRLGKLRYYAAGEYGDESQRPHYHVALFGHAFTKDRIITQRHPYLLWQNEQLTQAWGLGRVEIGALTYATAQYTASYVTKKLRSKQTYVRVDEETGELIELEQPRSFMSRNLGKTWWLENRPHVTHHDFVVINGARLKPPKMYDRWLKASDEKQYEKIKTQRQAHAATLTPDQTHARALIAHARIQRKSKSV